MSYSLILTLLGSFSLTKHCIQHDKIDHITIKFKHIHQGRADDLGYGGGGRAGSARDFGVWGFRGGGKKFFCPHIA